jgi:uncharacterized protein (DUF1697 family)
MPKSNTFVALLLGINLGKRRMKMADVKAVFESLGFENVKTLLASGNVIFESSEKNIQKLTQQIEVVLEKKCKFIVKVILREISEIQKIIDSEPFKNISVDKNTRLYVLFLNEKNSKSIPLPYTSPLKDFKILRVDDFEVYCVLQLQHESRTVDSMKVLGKEFGKNTTMRNWNTVLKLIE